MTVKYDLRESIASMHRMVMEDRAKRENRTVEEIEKELEKKNTFNGIVKPPPSAAGLGTQEYVDKLDVPGAMDDGMARLLYIIVMVVGVIFNSRWFIWIVATIVYLRHIFRRQIHKAKWEREHKNK